MNHQKIDTTSYLKHIPDGYDQVDLGEVFTLKDLLQESSIPILVQVLDWNRIPDSFRENILREYEVVL